MEKLKQLDFFLRLQRGEKPVLLGKKLRSGGRTEGGSSLGGAGLARGRLLGAHR